MKNILLTIRRLKKNKTASLLGISGLIVGLICVMFIFFWIVDEVSYDRFHDKIDRIFVVHAFLEGGQEKVTFDGCPPAVGPAIRDEYPEIKTISRYRPPFNEYLLEFGNSKYMEKVAFADYSLFDIMSFPFVTGGRGEDGVKNKVVLTRSTAEKFFGSENPVGRMIEYNNSIDLIVVGVIEDIPENSSIQFSALMPMSNLSNLFNSENYLNTWYNNSFITFGLLREPEDFEKVASSITNRIQEEMPESTNYLRAYQFANDYLYEKDHIRNIHIFSLIALMVLLAATLNFINLNTARSLKQIKETGLRKTLGATRQRLIRMIYADIAIICLAAFLIAIIIVAAALPVFNSFIGKNIDPFVIFSWEPLLVLGLIYVATVFLAGSYPSFFLTSFSPARTLQSGKESARSKGLFRNVLITVIFLVSLMLLSSTLIISRQTAYLQKMDLGFDKEQVFYIPLEGKLKDRYQVFKKEVKRITNVEEAAVMSYLPFRIGNNGEGWNWAGKDPEFKPLVTDWRVDEDMMATIGVEMKEGTFFRTPDQEGVIINEAFANLIGWDSFEGKSLEAYGATFRVLGVMKNIHFNSFSEEIQPLALKTLSDEWSINYLVIRAGGGDIQNTLSQIRDVGRKIEPDIPMDYGFFDEEMNSILAPERNLKVLVWTFSVFSVIVLVLGLLGVIMFMAEQRTKEIGIRKSMGEPVTSIVGRLIKPFLITGLAGFAVAIPLSWVLMNRWLQGFAYRIDVSIWIFMLAGLLILFVAIVTVIFQSVNAANRNPVEALRYE